MKSALRKLLLGAGLLALPAAALAHHNDFYLGVDLGGGYYAPPPPVYYAPPPPPPPPPVYYYGPPAVVYPDYGWRWHYHDGDDWRGHRWHHHDDDDDD